MAFCEYTNGDKNIPRSVQIYWVFVKCTRHMSNVLSSLQIYTLFYPPSLSPTDWRRLKHQLKALRVCVEKVFFLPHLWLGVRRTFVDAKNNMYFLSGNGVIKG